MNELPEASLFQIGLLLFDYLVRYRVEGDSMMPLLEPGEQVLVNREAQIKVGDIVIARHPFKKNIEMVKRVREINENGDYFLISDNLHESTDSRILGFITPADILGRVECRLG